LGEEKCEDWWLPERQALVEDKTTYNEELSRKRDVKDEGIQELACERSPTWPT